NLDHLRAHRRQVARGRWARDHPAEVEHADARQRQSTWGAPFQLFALRGRDAQAERWTRDSNRLPGNCLLPKIAAVPHLRRVEMLGDLTQGEARHVLALGGISDPLLVVVAAPL